MAYVLVVDDEASIRNFLTRWLHTWGHRVKTASNAEEALDVMTTDEAAEVMLCDVMMPGHDGMWLLGEVRQRWPQTPVIMATAVQDLPSVMKAQTDGAVDYVTKPFGREPLRQAIDRALANRQTDPQESE